MKRNGRAPSGAQRWRCRSCGAGATHSNDVAARELAAFVGWLLSRGTQADMPGRGRTFRRRAALFWPIWPRTRVQRCVFHAFCQVKRHTTSRPKLQAGVELYALARELLHVETLQQADWWVERFMQWCEFWSDFLEQKSLVEGRMAYTHRRLREARSGLVRLVNAGTLFTYLDPALCAEGPMPATNNRIEGGVNSQLREVLRSHRGLTKLKRVKAVFWWCYLHVECPKTMADTLREMPTDADVDLLRERYGMRAEDASRPEKWGEGLVWEELHHKTRYPFRNE